MDYNRTRTRYMLTASTVAALSAGLTSPETKGRPPKEKRKPKPTPTTPPPKPIRERRRILSKLTANRRQL